MKNRKTLTLGGSYAIRHVPTSFSAPDCTKRIYSVSWKVFRHRIEEIHETHEIRLPVPEPRNILPISKKIVDAMVGNCEISTFCS